MRGVGSRLELLAVRGSYFVFRISDRFPSFMRYVRRSDITRNTNYELRNTPHPLLDDHAQTSHAMDGTGVERMRLQTLPIVP